MKEDGVPAEALCHPGHGGLGTMSRPRDLPMRGAGRQSRRDGDEERGAFQVVGRREGLSRAGLLAVAASKAGDAFGVARLPVGAEALEAPPWAPMGDTSGPGAERRKEAGRTHRFRGQSWPAHGRMKIKNPAEQKAGELGTSVYGESAE